jgi:hypothetical protein
MAQKTRVAADSRVNTLAIEVIARVMRQACDDAEMVIALLRRLGMSPSSSEFPRMPNSLLLDLAAACRLAVWERAGVTIHREAGLPSAEEALRLAFEACVSRQIVGGLGFGPQIMALNITHFAWSGPVDLRAEVLLGVPDEDALVDAMAQFLFDRRSRPIRDVKAAL